MNALHEHRLAGCRPVPLAHYLKALGILRLVAEQADPQARGSWQGETFVLHTRLDRPALEAFFLHAYRPTPILAPWNGGSGFYPKDNRVAIEAVAASAAPRLALYRQAIALGRQVLDRLGVTAKVGKEQKPRVLTLCRNLLPDAVLPWLDAAYLLTREGPKYPPLLGTGGNDGRLDFTNNFMQRVLDLVEPTTGSPLPGAAHHLAGALFAEPVAGLSRGAVGQFLPAGAGGANAEPGFAADSLVNPWDYLLMIEGSLAFAAAAVRFLEHDPGDALAYPFTVRPSGAGYGSAASADGPAARAEMWLPLWQRPATAAEVLTLFAEGRARLERRPARDGVDFARAVAALGVDRGLIAFQRYGFQVRNGLAYFATPLGRHPVRRLRGALLLEEIDPWLSRFRRHAVKATAPASVARAVRQLDEAILAYCRQGGGRGRFQGVLVALGAVEQALGRSLAWTTDPKQRLTPVPALSPEWLREVDDGSAELRLAAALASVAGRYKDAKGVTTAVPLRRNLEPVRATRQDGWRRAAWDENAGRDVAWVTGSLPAGLNAVLSRRLVTAVQSGAKSYPDRGRLSADLADVAEFIEGGVDDALLERLLRGCLLLDWPQVPWDALRKRRDGRDVRPSALYALLKLALPGRKVGDVEVRVVPSIHRLAAGGRGTEASRQAIRRLRASGLPPYLPPIHQQGETVIRTAAALLFPLSEQDLKALAKWVLEPPAEAAGEPAITAPGDDQQGASP